MSIMIRPIFLTRFTSQTLTCTRRSFLLSGCFQPRSAHTPLLQSCRGTLTPKITTLVRYSDLSTQKYSMIYTMHHIRLLRAVSRLKLFQTAITLVILPPVYFLYFQGIVSLYLVSYSTGIALFAGGMLYIASHLFRRVVGMMYLDPSLTTLKVSHLTFWGKRQDIYLPVSDIMTIADTGDSASETILKLKRYSSPDTFYFSTRFGRVIDKQGFEKVFGGFQ
ncbi:transmembrane protein 186 [Poecilia reticulata]|uniref:Transmembrane protein 186 n=1 Tax=Poecilia reticulata TaxID=8081 RepID=A0A3P9MT39_POERE|nr:PREDICTED: transmembrane protein 186 [Poecilia reticulata]